MDFYGDISGRPAAAFRIGHPPGFSLHTRSARELSKPELVLELEEELEERP
jgi:hypothetical protein